jgi:hypothetical protein
MSMDIENFPVAVMSCARWRPSDLPGDDDHQRCRRWLEILMGIAQLLNVCVSPVIEARRLLLVMPAAAVRVAASARRGGDPGDRRT